MSERICVTWYEICAPSFENTRTSAAALGGYLSAQLNSALREVCCSTGKGPEGMPVGMCSAFGCPPERGAVRRVRGVGVGTMFALTVVLFVSGSVASKASDLVNVGM